MKKTTCVLLMAILASSAMGSSDPFVGKWVLDVRRSEYPAGTCPRTMVIGMETTGKGVRYRSDATYANGGKLHSEYTADYDGNQAIVMGARGMMLPVFLRRIDAHTVVASYTKELMVVATSRRVVSEDGRVMTITTISKDPSGKSVKTVGVYEKQLRQGPRNSVTRQVGSAPRKLADRGAEPSSWASTPSSKTEKKPRLQAADSISRQ